MPTKEELLASLPLSKFNNTNKALLCESEFHGTQFWIAADCAKVPKSDIPVFRVKELQMMWPNLGEDEADVDAFVGMILKMKQRCGANVVGIKLGSPQFDKKIKETEDVPTTGNVAAATKPVVQSQPAVKPLGDKPDDGGRKKTEEPIRKAQPVARGESDGLSLFPNTGNSK